MCRMFITKKHAFKNNANSYTSDFLYLHIFILYSMHKHTIQAYQTLCTLLKFLCRLTDIYLL